VCAPELAVTGGRGRDAYAPVMHDRNVEANMQLEKPGTILLDRYILQGRGGGGEDRSVHQSQNAAMPWRRPKARSQILDAIQSPSSA
jgi:hypothetical protein